MKLKTGNQFRERKFRFRLETKNIESQFFDNLGGLSN